MGPEQLTFAVAVELLREMKARGGIGRISRRLKRTRHYFTKWRKEFSLARFTTLAQALEAMGIHPAGFFVRALADHAPCGDYVAVLAAELLDTEADDMSSELDIVIAALADTLMSAGLSEPRAEPTATASGEGELLARIARRWASRGQESGELGREWLRRQDEIRCLDAPSVVDAIDQFLERIDPDEIPFAAGVLGSALRLDFYFDAAEASIRRGLKYADEIMDASEAGRLHQRLSMVFSDRGNFAGALTQNCIAIARYVDGGNSVGIARAQVDRGIFTSHMGYFERSNRAFFQALESLPASEKKNRATSLNGLAHNHAEQGAAERATHFARKCAKISVDPLNSAKLEWSRGAICAKLKNYGEARSHLETALATLQAIAPVDASLVTIDICEVCLLTGQSAEAYREARSLRRRNPLV
jgi:tetratricopeptide (TPR) repeat protein